jgi:23S rRNA (uracil1939-C5)-methyltransferase
VEQVQWWLQSKGPETAHPYYPLDQELYYTLPEFGIRMPFKPTDFTQVNHQINRLLVHKALGLLAVQKDDRVADLFCGLGNFTLPLATQAREVVGIEGSTALTTRALENARANGLSDKTSFSTRNLFEVTKDDLVALGKFDRMLVDPPRDGAMALATALAELRLTHPDLLPKRIVYVSCSPSTLARDAGILTHRAGYKLSKAGVANMFPHTSHVDWAWTPRPATKRWPHMPGAAPTASMNASACASWPVRSASRYSTSARPLPSAICRCISRPVA